MAKDVHSVVVGSGLISPEGPSFDRQGVLHFVDFDTLAVYQLPPEGKLRVFVNTGGIPTGSKFHRNGHLYVADGDLGIVDIAPDGSMRIAASEWQGKRLRGPNDLVFAANGDLYFTDPRGSDRDHPVGSVYILRADGSVERFAAGFQFPNGIVLSDDQRTLYLAETFPNRVWAFALDERGHELGRRVFVQLEGGLGPDGMAFGQDGNLYVTHFGKGVVAVVSPEGRVVDELPTGGAKPTNLAFWDTSLYVTETEKHQVVRLDVGVEGQVLYGLSPA